ncbi:hypothetical protein UlMin_017976 [Ulmus minor]
MVLNDAEEKQLTNKVVKEWLDDLKELIFRADELIDKINYEVLRRKLEGIFSKLEELTAQKDELGPKELTENIVSQRSHGPPLALESEVCGREDDKEAIMKLVLSDEDCGDRIPVWVVPMVGMGGIGKTTLAQLVYNDQGVEKHFQINVWVTVSTEFNVFNITKKIFKGVTFTQFNTEEVSELQCELSKGLEGKKFFFVLDDVWTEDYLLCPFKSGASGSKIIITTRSSHVASTMSMVEAYNLGGLSDDNCWKLFIQHAFKNENLKAYPDLKIG